MKEEQKWLEDVEQRLIGKMAVVADRNRHKIPSTARNGIFDDKSEGDKIEWWTNGFWAGMMWQMYHLTGNPMYQEIACEVETKLDRCLHNVFWQDHDNGFRWLLTAVAHYKYDKNNASLNRGMLAANGLAARYNVNGKFIRAWTNWKNPEQDNSGWAIIDCMMNLPLLFWASEVTKDPRYYQIAMNHADTTLKYFIRDDGSVNHIVEFDSYSGEFIRTYGGQGYENGSSWTRGQAWGIYGFVLSYLHSKEVKYLNASKRIAHYFIANIPDSGLIPIDFRQPAESHMIDSSAAAIAACGIIELARLCDGRESETYLRNAVKLLQVIDQKNCNWDNTVDNIVEKCSGAYHDAVNEIPMIFGDYYFMEAILKLEGKEFFLW